MLPTPPATTCRAHQLLNLTRAEAEQAAAHYTRTSGRKHRAWRCWGFRWHVSPARRPAVR